MTDDQLNHYNSHDLQRTLKEMNELANKKTKQNKVLLRESTPFQYRIRACHIR